MRRPALSWVGLATVIWLVGCAGLETQVEPPRISLAHLKVVDVQIFEQRFGLTLRIQNPNRNELTVEGISIKLEVNDETLAHGVGKQEVKVPGFGEALLDVEVVSTLFKMVEQLTSMEQRSGEPLDYRISGRITVQESLRGIPFEHSGRLGEGLEKGLLRLKP